MSTDYRRTFPPDLDGGGPPGDYIRPREFADPDEDEIFARVAAAFVNDTRRLPANAGRDDPSFHEPHWGHSTGLLRGTLDIDAVHALPERLRVGLFDASASYPVVCRPNFIVDRRLGLAAGRMAIKLAYPTAVPNVDAPSGEAQELDLLLAEGSPEVNGPGHVFFARDARTLALLGTVSEPSREMLRTLLTPRCWPLLARFARQLRRVTAYGGRPPATTTGWAGKAYYSLGAFALGDGAMKLCIRPRQTHELPPAAHAKGDPALRHRAAMEAWVAAGREAVFDLCVQLATDACIPAPRAGDPPKEVMAAEFCDLQWDEIASPYVRVGTLTFPATPQADLSDEFPWSPLQFNAWNTLPSMAPLGQTFRARKHAHKAHAEARLTHLYAAQPGAMVGRAPF
jgi:hypothetical protein